MTRRLLSVLTLVLAISSILVATGLAGTRAADPGCATPKAKAIWPQAIAGDWTSMGHDLSNSRSQPAETRISPSVFPPSDDPHVQDANGIQPRWTFSSSSTVHGKAGPGGDFQSTVDVVGGCVYGATGGGGVFAINEQTGKALWVNAVAPGGIGGGIFGITVQVGKVFVLTNGQKGPFVAALDQATGKILWTSAPIVGPAKGSTNASTVYFDGLVFAGYSESGGDVGASNGGAGYLGGYAIIDARNGKTLVNTTTIPAADAKKGYAGGGIWSTAVVDPATRSLYAGTGNPYGVKEHRYTNAIVKIDLDRSRPTFGQIVGSWHGDIDQYEEDLGALGETPACQNSPLPTTLEHPECGQIDLDFGAALNLFRDSKGRLLVGGLQKSGQYHAVDARTMKPVWSAIVGAPCALCNADATAFDAKHVYAVGTPGGVLVAMNKDDGSIAWQSPVADGAHYEAVSVANGVVYTIDTKGNLDTFDAATGQPDFSRPMTMDSGNQCTSLSGGVAIAQSMVFAPCGGTLIAYS